MTVAVLTRDLRGGARFQEALRGTAPVCLCERPDELIVLVAGGLAGVAVIDCGDRVGLVPLDVVRDLRERFPKLPIVAYCAPAVAMSRDVLALGRLGVNDLIVRDVGDAGATLRAAIMSAHDDCFMAEVLEILGADLPAAIMPYVKYCLENARRPISVPEVADALGVRRRSLVDRHAAAGVPSPGAIIAWCRLLLAARVLEGTDQGVERAALLLDFTCGAALRNMFRRYTGLSIREVRENGGMRCVAHLFRQALRPAVRALRASSP